MSEHRMSPQTAHLNAEAESSEKDASREPRPEPRRLSWCMAFASRLIDLEPTANPDALDEVADSQFEELCVNGRAVCDPGEAAEAFVQAHWRPH